MRFLFTAGLLSALQVSSYIGEAAAKPLNSVLVELRIRKYFDAYALSPDSLPLITVNEVSAVDSSISAAPDLQPNSTTMSILEGLLLMQRQQREAKRFMKREIAKRQIPSGHGRPECKKKLYKLCDGIYKMFWNNATNKCESCEVGEIPNPLADRCEKPESEEEEKERGKCPPGKKLDPSVPNQDENTENPKCIGEDEKDKCGEGESESTPTRNKPPKCAPDDEPDKKCEDEGTYDHKEIGKNGKMKHSCRTTREKEKEKENDTRMKMKEEEKKVMAPIYKAQEEHKNKERRARARRSACLAAGSVSFLPEEDVQALDEQEFEGLIEPDAQSYVPDIEIEDYMVTITTGSRTTAVTNVEMETAGPNFGAIIKALVRAFKSGAPGGNAAKRPEIPVSKPARVWSGAKKGPGTAASRYASLRKKDSYLNANGASKDAVNAASKSEKVKKILKSETFQECLSAGAGQALGALPSANSKRQQNSNKIEKDIGGNLKLIIDLDAKEKNNYPSPEDNPNILILVADETTDAGEDETPNVQLKTFQDGYNRDDRLYYEGCGSFKGWSVNNQITLLQSWNGCCKYYDGENCEPDTGLFKQTDREDGQLKGKDNDAVSSFWCTFDPNCAGAPGG